MDKVQREDNIDEWIDVNGVGRVVRVIRIDGSHGATHLFKPIDYLGDLITRGNFIRVPELKFDRRLIFLIPRSRESSPLNTLELSSVSRNNKRVFLYVNDSVENCLPRYFDLGRVNFDV